MEDHLTTPRIGFDALKGKYLKRFIVVIIDPNTGNEATLPIDLTNTEGWTLKAEEVIGHKVLKEMKVLTERFLAKLGKERST